MESASYPLPPNEHHSTTPLRWCRIARFGGRVILRFRIDLYVQTGTMAVQLYRDTILEFNVRSFGGAMGAEFLFMDGNARPHRANIVNENECFKSEDIIRMDWPAFSPDLNPVENRRDMLG
ncbi:transposable element Tc3 transposase [Trichonephila clavipes]|nr:transposable element Tc3 transposase [Trichonephila clavipes]